MAKKKKKKERALSKLNTEELKKKILELFQKKDSLLLREIYHFLHISTKDRPIVRKVVKQLVDEGKLVHIKKRRYALPEAKGIVKGYLRTHPDGFGFVETEDNQTIFIPPRKIGKAIDGDVVLVKVEKVSAKGPEGRIIKVVEKKRKFIVGYFFKRKKFYFVEPEDPKIPFELYIPKKRKGKAQIGNLVVSKIIQPTSQFGIPTGEVVKDIGDPNDLNTHCLAVIYTFDLPYEFSKKVEKELNKIPDSVREEDKKGRKNLVALDFVTIDGENARDFDDAIYVKREGKKFRLWVAIADVGYYVTKGSALDESAYQRGTSVYFPNMVIPMFPEKLSTGICSLNPQVERLVMVVEMLFSSNGDLEASEFYPAVIKSKKRLTYTKVKRMLIDRDKELIEENKALIPMLETAMELSQLIRSKREKRGSLDFDIPEPEVIMDAGGMIEDIIKRERNIAHLLIEDFMIAANEAVAEFLTEKGYPFLYRVHEEPDPNKLRQFLELLASYGIEAEVPSQITPHFFQELINQINQKEETRVFNFLLLRSLKQAKYSPYNVGHFGLASTCYCHFTSPIRRYPDLIVHRALKRALKNKKPPYTEEELEIMGKHLSQRERIAEEAEREILKRFQVFFMKDKIGEEFFGVITGVTAFGFFVELEEYMVSGVVRVIDLEEDIYKLNESGTALIGQRTGKTFYIGQKVKVRLKSVDLRKFYINFVLCE